MRDFITLDDLSNFEIEQIFRLADQMKEQPATWAGFCKGKILATLFFEPSTRTRTTFELAAKRLSADVLNVTVATSSAKKGESLLDTLHTLEALAAKHGDHRFRLIVGSDVLDEVAQWHRWDAIVESFAPIIVGRSGYRSVEGHPSFPEVSSTDVRDRLREGLSVRGLVTARVADVVGSWPP